jgi:hypothetical protein
MTTTELIKLLTFYEKDSSGKSREMRIYDKEGKLALHEDDCIFTLSFGNGCAGPEISLFISNKQITK